MRMSLVRFRETMADPINRVMYQGERIVLERHGKGVAALVSLEDLKTLEALEDAADVKAARRALAAIKSGKRKPVPWEQAKAELRAAGTKR